MNKIKTFGALLLLTLVFGGAYTFYRQSNDTPPSLTFENTQGAYLKQNNLPVEYTTADVTRFGTCTSAKSDFKAGSNVIYFTQDTKVKDLLNDYIVPENGLRLDLAYYSPGETGLKKGFHSFNGVVRVDADNLLSDDFMIPKNRPIIVVADQSGKFCKKDGKLKITSDYLTDKTIPSLSGIDSGWVLVATGTSLTDTIAANNIANRVDKIYTISRTLEASKLASAANFNSNVASSIVWLKLKAASNPLPPLDDQPNAFNPDSNQNPEGHQQGNDLSLLQNEVSVALTPGGINTAPITLGAEKAVAMSFKITPNRDLNVKGLKFISKFEYFQSIQLLNKTTGEKFPSFDVTPADVASSSKTLTFNDGIFDLKKDTAYEIEVVIRGISDNLVTVAGTSDLFISIPTSQGGITFHEGEVGVFLSPASQSIQARHETEAPIGGSTTVTAALVNDSSNSADIVQGASNVSVMKFTLKSDHEVNVKNLQFKPYEYITQAKIINNTTGESKTSYTAADATGIMTIDYSQGDLMLPANQSVELELIAVSIANYASADSQLNIGLHSVEFHEESVEFTTTSISTAHNLTKPKITVTNMLTAPKQVTSSGSAVTNRFQIKSTNDVKLSSIEINHSGLGDPQTTQLGNYDHYAIEINGVKVVDSSQISTLTDKKIILIPSSGYQIDKDKIYDVRIFVVQSNAAVSGSQSQFSLSDLQFNGYPGSAEVISLPIIGPIVEIE